MSVAENVFYPHLPAGNENTEENLAQLTQAAKKAGI